MEFILQTINGKLSTEVFELKNILDGRLTRCTHSYTLSESMKGNTQKGLIPVGDLDFVGDYLKSAYEIETMNHIEVPKCLRKYNYLKRVYEIANAETIIKHYWSDRKLFIKKVDKLKEWNNSITGRVSPSLITDGTYIVSSWMDIKSEYRVFVLEDNVVGCKHYSGNCLLFPDGDLIRQMVLKYSLDNNRPNAYTLDIAVAKGSKTDEYDTIILEVHPFVSCGTYGFCERDLLYMYRYGLDYYININKELE